MEARGAKAPRAVQEVKMLRKSMLILLGLVLGAAEIYLGWVILGQNFLGAGLIFAGLAYCIGGAFVLALGSRATTSRSDQALLALAPGAVLVLLAVPLEYRFLPALLPRAQGMIWLGLGIILLGMLLRLWTRSALKQSYQGNLQVQPGQRLVTTGPYRSIRHPGYLGFILLSFGLAVGFSSLSGLLGTALLITGLRYRIRVEEQMLVQEFGTEYQQYSSHTRRLIPGVW